MQNYRRILRRRAMLSLIDWFVIVLFLIAWMIVSQPVPTERAIPYLRASSHILVQLAELPDPTEAETPPDPQWTLYGDGTLIFKTDPSDSWWRAQLSGSDVQHILEVILHQQTFFGNTAQSYRTSSSAEEEDQLL